MKEYRYLLVKELDLLYRYGDSEIVEFFDIKCEENGWMRSYGFVEVDVRLAHGDIELSASEVRARFPQVPLDEEEPSFGSGEISDLRRQLEACRRYASGEPPEYLYDRSDGTSCGYGKLDRDGLFEFPLPGWMVRNDSWCSGAADEIRSRIDSLPEAWEISDIIRKHFEGR